jgi:catechol 2,3-dioxygenase-like lactoylglutathione lyase family enzyme
MTQSNDIYPMPLFPQLAVADVGAATAWYEVLGFKTVFSMPVMAHVRFRKYADVMLVDDRARTGQEALPGPRGQGVSVYLTLEDGSIDDVVARAEAADIDPVRGPGETSWNTREVAFRDPDGYEFVFSEVADSERPFEDVMGTAP